MSPPRNLFRETGVDGIGVADLMKDAGLTHGGFYRHFVSRKEPVDQRLPAILSEQQQSTQVMQDQQELFLSQLHSAQNEIKSLRDKLERAQLAASLDGLTKVLNRATFTRLLEHSWQPPRLD